MCFSPKSYNIVLLPLCFAFFLNSHTAFAQNQIIYEQFTTDQGLSENVVYCLLQDKRGFIWAGTHHGLNRYDGYSFKKYYANNDDSSSLSDNTINTMLQDSDGKLWIGTSNGLNYFDPETGRNVRVGLPGKGIAFGIIHLYLLSNDSLLVNTRDNEIYLFLTASKRWLKTIIKKELNVLGRFYAMDKQGKKVGVMGTDGNYVYDQVANEWKASLQTDAGFIKTGIAISHYYQDKRSNRYLFNQGVSFEVLDYRGKMITILDPGLFNSFTPPDIYEFAESFDGDVWIGTTMGLLQFNQASQTLSFRELLGDSKSLKGNKEIRCLLKDKDENLWLGTFGEGLLKCRIQKSPFSSIGLEELTPGNFQRMIYGLYQWPGGEIAAETGSRNFSIIHNNKVIGYTNSNKMGIDKIFYVTTGKRMEEVSKVQQTIARNLFNRTILQPNQFLLHDSDAIAVTAPAFTIFNRDTSFGNSYYTTNAFDDGEFYWAASINGLLRVDKKSFDDTLFVHVSSDPFSLNENFLYCVTGDEKKNLWIGTKGGGLNYFDHRHQKYYNYTTKDGLPDNVIYYIVPDKKGNLWLSTNNGLSRFNIVNKTFQNFSRRDGLLNSEFNRNGGVRTEDGTMYFSGTSGIDYFRPEDIGLDTLAPGIYFSSLSVNGKETPVTDEIKYLHTQNNFNFFFTANDFIRPDLIYYRYRLIGVGDEWIRLQGVNNVSFNALPPGKYKLEIQSSYNNLQWGSKAVYDFTILTPWWRTNWFYLLLGIFIIIVLYTFYRYRITQLKKLMAIRNRISQDLHDEVGATLSSIHVYSSVAQKAIYKNTDTAIDALKNINENTRQVMENMNDIVWAINTGQMGEVSLEAKLKNFGYELLTPLNIECSYEIEKGADKKLLNIEARKNILLIAKEAMNNAAKYSAASQVEIKLYNQNKYLHLEISDNGKGFDISNKKHGNGLLNMKKRTETLGGDFQISSSPGNGTKVQSKIPLTTISDTK